MDKQSKNEKKNEKKTTASAITKVYNPPEVLLLLKQREI